MGVERQWAAGRCSSEAAARDGSADQREGGSRGRAGRDRGSAGTVAGRNGVARAAAAPAAGWVGGVASERSRVQRV